MKAVTRLIFAVALASASVAATGCGTRDYFNAPDPAADKKASEAPAASGVAVTVIDANSQPVAGASVSLADAKGTPVGAAVTADAGGKATFAKVAAGSYVATASFKGLQATHALDVEGEGQVLVSLLLAPANGLKGTIGGNVVDANSGQPLNGATVSVIGTQTTTVTNPDGSYLLKNVPAGNPTVVAIYKGYRETRQAVGLKGGQLAQANLRLAPGANSAHFGMTLVATTSLVGEFDRSGGKRWGTRKGGSQARLLENGNFLIANGGGVDEVSTAGSVVWSYKPLIFGRLGDPQGASRAKSGLTWIADTENNRIVTVSASNQLQKKVPHDFNRPNSVERVEARKSVLVADTGNNRVLELDDNGRVLWAFGSGNTDELNKPTYATRLPNGNTLIADTGNSRVLEVTYDHRMAFMYGGDGKRETCFLPNSATRTASGNILIADTGNHRVIEVKPTGVDTSEVIWTLPIEAPLFAERL